MNCNIKFPGDAKVEYLTSSAEGVSPARCEVLPWKPHPILLNDAEKGIWHKGVMHCKFKVTFSDGNDCTCQVTTTNKGIPRYYIEHEGCECMRITRCAGDECPKGSAGVWPCGEKDNTLPSPHSSRPLRIGGCKYAPDVILTVESSWK